MRTVKKVQPSQAKRVRSFMLGRDILLGPELAVGGEGRVYTIASLSMGGKGKTAANDAHTRYVAKLFHKPNPEKVAKLRAMIAHPPDDPTWKEFHHISIAWPVGLIVNEQRKCIGFIMPYIERSTSFPLLKIYNPRDRERMNNLSYTWEYLLCMAFNLAYLLEELHRKGYVVGDLNESNILVTSNAMITLIDCDSVQVPGELQGWERLMFWRRPYFRCTVGKPEYTAPELQGRSFSEINRTPDHDNYALAVIIFLLLMEGRHPYAGVWQGRGEPPTQAQRMRARDFPYGSSQRFTPAKRALPLDTLPLSVQHLMLQCFDRRPWFLLWQKRPTAHRWKQALEHAQNRLVHCDTNYSHVYSNHLDSCPWCRRIRLGLPDPFPPARGQELSYVAHSTGMLRAVRRFFSRLAQLSLIPLALVFYIIEIYYWPRYNSWFSHVIWEVAGIFWLLLLLLPVVVCLTLARRLKSF